MIGKFKVKIPATTPGSIQNLRVPFMELRRWRVGVFKRLDVIEEEKAQIHDWSGKYTDVLDAIRRAREEGAEKKVDAPGQNRATLNTWLQQNTDVDFHSEELGTHVDTNLVHEGLDQRVLVTDEFEASIFDKVAVHEAKLALLEQERKAILEWLRNSPQINIIHAVYRGCKGRRDLSETRKSFWIAVEFSAAMQIQAPWRRVMWGARGRHRMAEQREEARIRRRLAAVPPIQRVWRGHVGRYRADEMRIARRLEAEMWAAVCKCGQM